MNRPRDRKFSENLNKLIFIHSVNRGYIASCTPTEVRVVWWRCHKSARDDLCGPKGGFQMPKFSWLRRVTCDPQIQIPAFWSSCSFPTRGSARRHNSTHIHVFIRQQLSDLPNSQNIRVKEGLGESRGCSRGVPRRCYWRLWKRSKYPRRACNPGCEACTMYS